MVICNDPHLLSDSFIITHNQSLQHLTTKNFFSPLYSQVWCLVFDQQPSGLSIFTPLYPPSLPSPEPPCSAFLHFFHYLFDPLVFTYFPPSLVSMFDRLTYLLTRTLNFLKPPLLATYSTNKIPILVHPES